MTVALVITCPDCDHTGDIDADELEEMLEGGEIACCPECGSQSLQIKGDE